MSKTKQHSIVNTEINSVGTVCWAAPEYLTVKRLNERSEKGDVYSFGVIAWELVTMETPWNSKTLSLEDIKESVINGQRLKIPDTCPKQLKEVIEMCWQHGNRGNPT